MQVETDLTVAIQPEIGTQLKAKVLANIDGCRWHALPRGSESLGKVSLIRLSLL